MPDGEGYRSERDVRRGRQLRQLKQVRASTTQVSNRLPVVTRYAGPSFRGFRPTNYPAGARVAIGNTSPDFRDALTNRAIVRSLGLPLWVEDAPYPGAPAGIGGWYEPSGIHVLAGIMDASQATRDYVIGHELTHGFIPRETSAQIGTLLSKEQRRFLRSQHPTFTEAEYAPLLATQMWWNPYYLDPEIAPFFTPWFRPSATRVGMATAKPISELGERTP